jgi:hypothetical protein
MNNKTKNGQFAVHETQRLIIKGILTSRIETRSDYYYGFFKLENQNQDIPVVFKTKPNLVKGSQVELTGQ